MADPGADLTGASEFRALCDSTAECWRSRPIGGLRNSVGELLVTAWSPPVAVDLLRRTDRRARIPPAVFAASTLTMVFIGPFPLGAAVFLLANLPGMVYLVLRRKGDLSPTDVVELQSALPQAQSELILVLDRAIALATRAHPDEWEGQAVEIRDVLSRFVCESFSISPELLGPLHRLDRSTKEHVMNSHALRLVRDTMDQLTQAG